VVPLVTDGPGATTEIIESQIVEDKVGKVDDIRYLDSSQIVQNFDSITTHNCYHIVYRSLRNQTPALLFVRMDPFVVPNLLFIRLEHVTRV
jgi:hypothetical protein